MDINKLKKDFFNRYGNENGDVKVFFSPGRVNLIGEHTDYNGGYVFPCALTFGTYLVVRKTSDKQLKFASVNFDYSSTIPVDKITEKQDDKWVNYPLGVLNQLKDKGVEIEGMEMLFSGDIPLGSGLSSSASIEMVTAYAVNKLSGARFEILDLVKLGQAAENQFVGVNCGIMDQFASGMGLKDHALMLNCDTLEYDKVPVKMDGYKIVISNTNKPRGLADSKFNERRSECEKAVEYISKVKPINNLSELDLETFNNYTDSIPDEIIIRRARHVISENKRVLDAVKALKANKLDEFGDLMNQSHDSLRDDYEVTGFELDTLVDEARKIKGVIGSRMTGAGFGGCTVSIVEEGQIDEFTKHVGEAYQQKTNLKPEFYIAEISDGSKEIS